jgi:rod shape determining protein RodA
MNWFLLIAVACLLAIGLTFIYGIGQQHGDRFAVVWKSQLMWVIIGILGMLLMATMDYEWLGRLSHLVYLGSILALILVLAIGVEINGAKSWLVIGGKTIQPAEFAKLGLAIPAAWLAARKSVQLTRWQHLLPFVLLLVVPFALVSMQPDQGSAMVLVPIMVGILFVAGIPSRWLVYGALVCALAAPVVYRYVLEDHQRSRIIIFLNPASDTSDAGWNARQSLLAVGSGGMWGKGFMQGTQYSLGYLPRNVSHTDFIFSVIAEETGFIGSCVVILLEVLILLLCVYIASRARDEFGRNLACGIGMMLCCHVYINVGMTIGMAPIIGIPLPFVSSGGTFMVLTMGCIGILQSIYIRRH